MPIAELYCETHGYYNGQIPTGCPGCNPPDGIDPADPTARLQRFMAANPDVVCASLVYMTDTSPDCDWRFESLARERIEEHTRCDGTHARIADALEATFLVEKKRAAGESSDRGKPGAE